MTGSVADSLPAMTGLRLGVPRDAVAHIHPHLADASLELMELNMSADVCTAAEVSFQAPTSPAAAVARQVDGGAAGGSASTVRSSGAWRRTSLT